VTVLDAGRVIASGTFAEIQKDSAVRTAYLGDDTGKEARTDS
jgi:ABC-type branched-subunit amino acid transport system ATPase component